MKLSSSTFISIAALGSLVFGFASAAREIGSLRGVVAESKPEENPALWEPDRDLGYEHSYCWRETHTRPIGSIPTECGPGTEKIGLLCYENCPSGYFRWGVDCHQSCPSGFHDSGAYCKINEPSSYVRTGGYAWQWGDPAFSNSGQFQRCEADHGSGKCQDILGVVYPLCADGYTQGRDFGVWTCYRNKALNCAASGLSDAWNIIDVKNLCPRKIQLGKLAPLVCAADKGEDSLGLCFTTPCNPGYEAAGAVCWVRPPKDWVRCGMGAAVDSDTCGSVTTSQVTSVGELAMNIIQAALSLTSGGTLIGVKAFLDVVAKFNEFVNLYGSVVEIISDLKNSDYQEWIDIAGASESTTPADRLRMIAQIISVVDQTGIAGVVSSYSYPMCSEVSGFTLRTAHNTYLSVNVDVLTTSSNQLAWETWHQEDNSDGTISLISHFGTYLTAHPDGQLTFASHNLPWERWTVVKNSGDASISLRSAHGTYLGATPEGSVYLVGHNQPWEHFWMN